MRSQSLTVSFFFLFFFLVLNAGLYGRSPVCATTIDGVTNGDCFKMEEFQKL